MAHEWMRASQRGAVAAPWPLVLARRHDTPRRMSRRAANRADMGPARANRTALTLAGAGGVAVRRRAGRRTGERPTWRRPAARRQAGPARRTWR